MSSKVTIRGLVPEDMPAFVDLCESRPNLDREGAQKRARVVEWVAFHNPCDDGKPTYFVGERDGKLVAHLGRMPTVFMMDGEEEMGCYFHDLYVHPDLRRQQAAGFFLTMKLYREAEKSTPGLCTMIWTNEINIALQRARKYEQLWTDRRVCLLGLSGKLERSFRFPGPLRAPLIALTETAVRKTLKAVNRANGRRFSSTHSISRLERFDERFDELVNRSLSIGVSPRKDHRYLNWKYIDRPFLAPICLQLLDESGELAGFCVAVLPDEYKTASIAELYVVDDDAVGIHSLLTRALDELTRAGADRVEAVASDTPYAEALHQRLFRRDLRVPLFLAHHERSTHAQSLLSPSRWHVSLGDSEGPF